MKNFFKFLLIDIIILVFLFSVFEVGLRLFWKMSALKGELYMASKNHILRYELKPNVIYGQVAINSDGFRGKDYPIVKSENTFRIIVLGDSEAFSASLQLEDTMPGKLESRLKTTCRGVNFEVLNMGVQGYNTIQELEFLRSKGLKYKPDLVILYYTFNDPDHPEYYFRKNFFNKNFLVVKYIQYRIKKTMVKRDRKLRRIYSEEENYKYLYTHDSWEYTKNAILEMAVLAQQNKFSFVLAINPEMSNSVLNFKENYPYRYINEKLASLRDYGITVIDPTWLLQEKDYKVLDLVIGPDDRYKNAKANFIIASYVFDNLKNHNIISCELK